MAKTRNIIPSGAWPRLMRQDLAAAYLDMAESELDRNVGAGVIPAPALMAPKRWDKEKLDQWLDGRSQSQPTTSKDWLKKLDDAHTTQAR